MSRPSFMGLRGSRLKAAMLMCVVIPSFMLFGYNNGSTGGITTLPSFVKQFPRIDTVNTTGAAKKHNATILGIVTGCYDLGAVTGSLSCIAYSDKIGRRKTIFIGLILSIIALAIESSSYALAQLVVGRIFIGFAIGTISAAVPVWQSECSSAAHRGAFVIMEGLSISSGITLSEWISFGLTRATTGSGAWRGTIVMPVIFAFLAMPCLFLMPESPRWLAKHGRFDEARQVLAALEDQDEHSEHINREMADMQLSLSEVKGSFSAIFKNGKERVLNRTLLAMTAQAMQQMCGISALVFYTKTIFLDLGFKGTDAGLLACGLATWQTLSSTIPLFTVDRFGRRALFMFAGAGMCVCLSVVAGVGGTKTSVGSGVTCAFIFLYDFFYPIGNLGLTFLYATEVAPLKLRVPITAIANATQWLCQFVVAQVTPPGTTNLGTHYYAIYAAINGCAVPIVYLFFPETNGRSLEEMDHIFENSSNAFAPPRVARQLGKMSEDGEHQMVGAGVGTPPSPSDKAFVQHRELSK